MDLGGRQEPPQVVLQAGNIALNGDVETGDLLAIRPEDEDVRFAHLLAEEVDAPRRARDRIRHGGVGDENVVSVLWQVDHQRLVQSELDTLLGGRGADAGAAIGVGRSDQTVDRQRRGGDAERKGKRQPAHNVFAGQHIHRNLPHAVHCRAPTSETSPDLMKRTVPLRPLPESR